MIAFKDKSDGYYQLDWDGVSKLPEWTKGMTQVDVVESNVVPPTYRELRAVAYPSFADQFDLLYHGGMDVWKAAIQAVKDKYPKPVEPAPAEPIQEEQPTEPVQEVITEPAQETPATEPVAETPAEPTQEAQP
jgi:hypothetical protein